MTATANLVGALRTSGLTVVCTGRWGYPPSLVGCTFPIPKLPPAVRKRPRASRFVQASRSTRACCPHYMHLVLRSLTSRVATALHSPSRISSPHSGSICIRFPGIGFAPRIPSTQRPRPALRVAYDTAPFPSLFLDTHRYNTVCLSLLAICVERPWPASLLCSGITESIYSQFVDSALPDLSQCLSSAAPRKTSRRLSGRTTSPTVAHPSLKTSLP